MSPLTWLRRRDRGLVAVRRAARTALVMSAVFALSEEVVGDPQVATVAAIGSFAMLMGRIPAGKPAWRPAIADGD